MRVFPRRLEVAAVLAAGLLVVWLHHPRLLAHLNGTFFGVSGDGLKNYYTVLYHVRYDSTLSHFQGMNYPAGEHVVFTDNQPALSNAIKLVDRLVPVAPWTVAIVNAALLLSLAATGTVLFLLLRDYDVPPWYAAPTALAIAFLSPQVDRLSAHYGLAYGWVLPTVWWLTVRLDRRPSWRRSALIGLVILVATGLHIYYLALSGAFVICYWGVRWLQRPDRAALARAAGYACVQALLPLLLYRGWIAATDAVRDRPTTVGMIFGYWEGVFLPIEWPLGRWLGALVDLRDLPYETIAYIGLPAAVWCGAVLLRGLARLGRGRWRDSFRMADDQRLTAALWAAIVLLLVAFGVPLRWLPPAIVEHLGPVAQLRAIARFAWVFYYVITVAVVVRLYSWGRSRPRRQWRWAIWWVPAAVLIVEAWAYHARYPEAPVHPLPGATADRAGSGGRFPIEADHYQAIIPLPYFHVGSESGDRYPGAVFQPVLMASLETGLPLTAVYLSRTSARQTRNNLELVGRHDRVPALLDRVDPDRPFLLWRQKGESLDETEDWLVDAGTPIYEDEAILLLELTPAVWRSRIAEGARPVGP